MRPLISPASLRERDILVAILDANEQSRQFLTSVLGMLGVERVVDFPTPQALLTWLSPRNTPQVLLVDAGLAPMSGVAFARYLRTIVGGRAAYVPIILIGARVTRETLTEARNAGVNEFIAKPVSPPGLSARLRAVLEAPRPFVRTPDYFGPDRRRRQVEYSGENRRGSVRNDAPLSAP
ncbi:response regulator [Pararhodospirillum oryzae]|uniref:Response regulator n=1 Tax=Pararhodospirillum oryzae TaxID=478448 RepID=A0A512H584_9PROT|nr:response regulator [Pararhodospirillum oryzae]GEO80636.1 response regulator [Pararhodospirillum oryzae]